VVAHFTVNGDRVAGALTAQPIGLVTHRAFYGRHPWRSVGGLIGPGHRPAGNDHNGRMLLDRITAEIRSDGPIGFDRFMEIALYDPDGGYFATGALRSDRAGDFLTSPEISPMFGETIAGFIGAEHGRLGAPFSVIEVGGGSGSLLRSLLDSLAFDPESVVAVERSEAARASIEDVVPEAEVLDRISRSRGVIVANELLDNMPAALAVRRGSEWRERRVGIAGPGLELVELDPLPIVAEWAERHAGSVPEGAQVEVQIQATEWVVDHLRLLESGAMLLFDYGDLAANLEHRRAEGTVRTYRRHHLGPDPLAEPGATDITMDVDFSAVMAAAGKAGVKVELLRQDDFLEQWGLGERLSALRRGVLIAARQGRTMDQLKLKSQVIEAETLLHPRGLGDFRVAVCRK